ncbi:Histone H2A [Zea mays]|uniref:Histone H2A n=1 Tax=Zea mays TaxID=4577 RepID=A0A1D6NJW6_MAIZE|nr:Histone H2A [Zea mays]
MDATGTGAGGKAKKGAAGRIGRYLKKGRYAHQGQQEDAHRPAPRAAGDPQRRGAREAADRRDHRPRRRVAQHQPGPAAQEDGGEGVQRREQGGQVAQEGRQVPQEGIGFGGGSDVVMCRL